MRKLFFYVLIIFTTIYTGAANAKLPDWIAPVLKKYPIETYLYHVGKGPGKDGFEQAVADAHRRIATDILQKVEWYVIRYNKSELEHDMVREHYSAVLEDYCNSRQAWPAMKLEEFQVRNLSVDYVRPGPPTYALVYIERAKLKRHYAKRVLELSKEINRRLASAKSAEVFERKLAVRRYLETYPLYEALKEAEIVQIGAEYEINSTDAFKRLAKAATYTRGTLKMSHREVIKRVAELDSPMLVFPDDIAKATAIQLLQQLGNTHRRGWIEPLIYEDSEMICRFEREFSAALPKHLHYFEPTSPDLLIDRTEAIRLTASYWEDGDEITIRTMVRDPNTGDFIATAVVQFLVSQLRDRRPIDFQPPNYDLMRSEMEPYYTPPPIDVTVPIGEELEVEVWTHEGRGPLRYFGRGPLRYVEDDKVKIFVRVNQPAYVRLLYILADGKRTLLHNSFYIAADHVDRAVEIGEFLCAAPFGPELLVVEARTEGFKRLETHEENGYFYLIDPNPESAAQRFRGLKRIPAPDPDSPPIYEPEPPPSPSFQQSEKRIVVTTVEK